MLLALSVALLHADLLTGRSHGRGEDDLELTIPYNVAFWRAIEHAESPWWLPWIDGGTSAFARFPYLGPFYPAALAFRLLPPVRAVELVLLAHVLLAAFGVRAWARALGASESAALLAAFIGAGSSVWHVADREGYATEAPVWTWLPWALAAIERAPLGNVRRQGALAALAVGLLALGGHATDLYVGALTTAIYLAVRVASLRRDPAAAKCLVTASAIAGALGAGIGLAFWLPVSRTIDLGLLAAERVPKPPIPHPLLRLTTPFDAWGTKDSLYVGVTTLVWIALGLRAPTRRRAWPFAAVAGFTLLLSFGPTSPLWRALSWLPGFAALDQGNVFSWPFAMIAAMGAGIGATGLEKAPRPRAASAIAALRWLTAIELVLYLSPGWLHDLAPTVVRSAEGHGWLASASVLGEAARLAPGDPRGRVLPIERSARESDVLTWRNDALRLGSAEDVRASAHLGSPRLRRVLRALGPWPVDWDSYSDDRARAPGEIDLGEASRATRVLDLLNVGTVVTDIPVLGDAFERGGEAPPLAFWRRRVPLPRYRLVSRVDVVSGEEAAAERILAASFDPRAGVVLEDQGQDELRTKPAPPPTPAGDAARVRTERYEPGDIALTVDARDREILVIGETWFRGWHAAIDGHPAPLVRANYLHMALAPPTGPHLVELSYRPPGLREGVVIALISLAMAAGLALVPPARGRARPPSPGHRDRTLTER